jgi:hypothetical protein
MSPTEPASVVRLRTDPESIYRKGESMSPSTVRHAISAEDSALLEAKSGVPISSSVIREQVSQNLSGCPDSS